MVVSKSLLHGCFNYCMIVTMDGVILYVYKLSQGCSATLKGLLLDHVDVD